MYKWRDPNLVEPRSGQARVAPSQSGIPTAAYCRLLRSLRGRGQFIFQLTRLEQQPFYAPVLALEVAAGDNFLSDEKRN